MKKIRRSQLVFNLLGKRYGFDLTNMVSFVGENQFWSDDQIYAYQFEQLKKLISHAYLKVHYYHKVMNDLGMKPGDFKCIDDLKHFPIIGKDDIMHDYDSFLASGFKEYHPMERSTGGTTGVPFKYYNDVYSWGLNWATKIRTFSWGGYRFGEDRIAVLKGGSMLGKGDFSPVTRFWKYLHNYYTIPIINMTPETMDFHFRKIVSGKIRFIRGFPSALYTFSKYLASKGVTYPMKGVFTSAEMLYDYQRQVIEQVFGHYIIDAYGCGDGMAGANQCELHDGYHANIETCYMEITDDSGESTPPGAEGNVVVTSLHDYAMPLIRYAPGDMAIPSRTKCKCGRNLPLLSRIIGRSADLFHLPNGRVLNGLSIPFEDWFEKIEKFQLIQEKTDLVVLRLVPKENYTPADEKHMYKLLAHNLGEGVTIKLDYVDHIDNTAAGKFRYIISRVN